MTTLDDQPNFEERFASLEVSSRLLAENVQALTLTLQVVNELQLAQREQAKVAAATNLKVASIEQETESRIRRTRQVMSFGALGLAILIPVATLLVYASLIDHVNDLLTAQNRSSYTNCNLRNQGTIENASREEQLAQLEKNDQVRAIHTTSARKLRASIIDCSKYLRKVG